MSCARYRLKRGEPFGLAGVVALPGDDWTGARAQMKRRDPDTGLLVLVFDLDVTLAPPDTLGGPYGVWLQKPAADIAALDLDDYVVDIKFDAPGALGGTVTSTFGVEIVEEVTTP